MVDNRINGDGDGKAVNNRSACGGLAHWNALKGAVAIIICGWALYVNFLIIRNDHCRQRLGLVWGKPAGLIHPDDRPTSLENVVFGIAASAKKWKQRKEYVHLWWQPGRTRGFVWLDRPIDDTGPLSSLPLKISENTSKFNYTHPNGLRSAIRISRIVSETFRLGLPDVRWFVMGDDDTIFFCENLIRVLSKYDHNQYYYIGSNSESAHTYGMAFGGGGFAVSYPLAAALEKMQDDCLQRYPNLYGSDHRIQVCLAELGVPLTRESGFHQVDFHGDLFGLLAAHPIAPLVSLHHLDAVAPVFPHMTRIDALRRLVQASRFDSDRLLQQSICYDKRRKSTISVSWGYAVQVFDRIELPRLLEYPLQTFETWKNPWRIPTFLFNTRRVSKDPCERPAIFFMENTSAAPEGNIVSSYERQAGFLRKGNCNFSEDSPAELQRITIISGLMMADWKLQAPRRQCCEVSSSENNQMEIKIRSCRHGETISPP